MTAPARECQPEAAPVRQHAPLPWRLAGKGTIRGAGNNSWVCSMNWRDRAGNSALLLEAVNSHATLQARVEELTKALEAAREEIVMAIAFIGRDLFTDRINATADSLHTRLCKADADARLALSVSLEQSGSGK